MNLAGNQAKQLFKTLRTGGRPPTVALWAAATVVDQIRKRQRPDRELIATKKLKPGESYVIRVPKEGEASLASTVGNDTVATVTSAGDRSITSELLAAATDLIGAATASDEPPTDEAPVASTLSRRQRRKARRSAEKEAEPEEPAALGRRETRRAERLASLDGFEVDRQSLSRRRRRKLRRAEARARRRPSRRRTRKARRQHKQAAAALRPSRRARRKLQAATNEVEYRTAKVERRPTRRRRRKLKKAEKALGRLEP
ncbi:MAG: hypothetical protein OER12_03840 [Acidimicrobiia bacterium]|nr:hypothetical protein [Acidimicrobiia bacterium]